MGCLGLYFDRCLFLLVGFIMLPIIEVEAHDTYRTDSNYYIYGKSTPVLNDIGKIAAYYDTSIEYILSVNRNYNEDFRDRQYLFEDTLSNLDYEFSQKNSWLHGAGYNTSMVIDKMLKYQYAHLFPLEKGDTLWLPLGAVNPIDRTTHFKAFDKLFEEKETELIRDSLLSNYIDFAILDDMSGDIPYKLWECVADTIQEEAFLGGLAYFKFIFNAEMTAYLIKADYEKPYSVYLHLIRNSDKKMIGEKPILVYYRNEATPCEYQTDTKITDYNQDGHLDLIIYQAEFCVRGEGITSNHSYRIFLWEEEKTDFLLKYEVRNEEENMGWLQAEDISKLEQSFSGLKE